MRTTELVEFGKGVKTPTTIFGVDGSHGLREETQASPRIVKLSLTKAKVPVVRVNQLSILEKKSFMLSPGSDLDSVHFWTRGCAALEHALSSY